MVAGVAAVALLLVGEPFSQKELDERNKEQMERTAGEKSA